MTGDTAAAGAAASAHLDRLALRLFGALLLSGGCVLLGLLVWLLQWPRAGSGFVLPGLHGRHVLAFAAVPVLATSGGLMGGLGLLGLVLARTGLVRRLPRPPVIGRRRRPILVLLGGVALLIGVLVLRS